MDRIVTIVFTCVLLLAFCLPAHADEYLVPTGAVIRVSGVPDLTLQHPHYIVDRESVDNANATATAKRRLEKDLSQCRADLLEMVVAKDGPDIWATVKWTAIATTVMGAFAAGIWVGGR